MLYEAQLTSSFLFCIKTERVFDFWTPLNEIVLLCLALFLGQPLISPDTQLTGLGWCGNCAPFTQREQRPGLLALSSSLTQANVIHAGIHWFLVINLMGKVGGGWVGVAGIRNDLFWNACTDQMQYAIPSQVPWVIMHPVFKCCMISSIRRVWKVFYPWQWPVLQLKLMM